MPCDTAMASSQNFEETNQKIPPPSSFIPSPLTPPSTDENLFMQAPRVIALFREIQAGQHFDCGPWTEFLLVPGEFDKVQRLLDQDEDLLGFVEDKIRYDYDAENHLLIVRMPSVLHELFIACVEDAILSRLKSIREGSDDAATFAQKVISARSSIIRFPAESNLSDRMSKNEPDMSFRHKEAHYPGVIIEVSYSQKRKWLGRLAQNYLLGSDASVQAVVGLDIEYGNKKSRAATLTVWRARVCHASTGDQLRVEQEVTNEVFRDKAGNATYNPGLQLRLSDFACEELVQEQLGDQDEEIHISSQQLCQFLDEAELLQQQSATLRRHILSPSIQRIGRSGTPPEELSSEHEAEYIQQERKVAKRLEKEDCGYKD